MVSFRGTDQQVEALRRQIELAEQQLQELKLQLQQAEHQAQAARQLEESEIATERSEGTSEAQRQDEDHNPVQNNHPDLTGDGIGAQPRWPLEGEDYKRYGRQLIMPEIGLQGQLRLKGAKVLLVGMGGLGCPAAAYLAGAGVGTLGLVDGDTVEMSNLHRQMAHSTAKVGMSKVDSAYEYLASYVGITMISTMARSDVLLPPVSTLP